MYTAGLRKHPLAGFSRSIYYTLTGQKVPVTLTHLSGNTQIRSKVDNISTSFIMPNPSNDGSVTIRTPAYDRDVKYMITVHNMTGKEVYRSNLSQIENNVETDLTNGVYVVALYGNGQSIKTQKWVIVK